MADPLTQVNLFKGLQAELRAIESLREWIEPEDIQRRYAPLLRFEEFKGKPKVSIYIEQNTQRDIARNIWSALFTFGVAIQIPAADQVEYDNDGNAVLGGIDNLAAGDDAFNLANTIKALWQPDGALFEKQIAGCSFVSVEHDPPYEPLHLMRQGIYSAILDVTYQTN
jgi:hypothetical protein